MVRRKPIPSAGRRSAKKAEGFNLVVLAMAVTVLTILATMALPAWSHQIRREKEAELIFRGLQYAEAIRVFQIRQGRLPVQLRELVEVQPRSIRQLWKNPITEDGSWLLLPGAGGQPQPGRPQPGRPQPGQPQPDQQTEGQPPRGRQPPGRPGQPGQPTAIRVVPGDKNLQPVSIAFMGVASPEGETAVKIFMGSNEIKEWRFTVDLVRAMIQAPHENFARPINSGVFWKPFPPGVNVQTQTTGGGFRGPGGAERFQGGQGLGGGAKRPVSSQDRRFPNQPGASRQR